MNQIKSTPHFKLSKYLLGSSLFLITSLTPSHHALAESLGFSFNDVDTDQHNQSIQVQVFDDNTLQPITHATINISPNNVITVSKEGYAATTLIGVKAKDISVYLKPIPVSTKTLMASGNVGGWKPNPSDSPVYLGLVFKALSIFDLLHFEISSVVSPEKDTIDIWGDRQIPSNIVLPEQDIPIFIGSAHVNKTHYRLPLSTGTESHLVTAHGEISSSDLISIGTGGGAPSLDTVNSLNFTRIGISDVIKPSADVEVNLNASIELIQKYQVDLSPPPFKADVMLASVTDMAGDRKSLVPTDIKLGMKASYTNEINSSSFNDNQYQALATTQLKGTARSFGKTEGIVAIAMANGAKRLSGTITINPKSNLKVNNYLMADDLKDFTKYPETISMKPTMNGLSVAVLEANFEPKKSEKPKTFPVWYIYSLPSAGDVNIKVSDIPDQKFKTTLYNYSLMSLDFGSQFNEKEFNGQNMMKNLERFSRSMASYPKQNLEIEKSEEYCPWIPLIPGACPILPVN